jgi:hypothetical protein
VSFTSERYLSRNGQNGRRGLQAHDAGSAHENRFLDVRDGASHRRVSLPLNLTRRERRLVFAKRLYAGELPDEALHAFADGHVREKLDEAGRGSQRRLRVRPAARYLPTGFSLAGGIVIVGAKELASTVPGARESLACAAA